MNLFMSNFSYFVSKIIRILRAQIIVPLDSRHLSTYLLIHDSSGLTLLSVKVLKSYVLTSTIGAEHTLYGPSPPKMMFSNFLRSNPEAVSKYLPRIILYLLLADLAT